MVDQVAQSPSHLVNVGKGDEYWHEHRVVEDCELGSLLRGDDVFATASRQAKAALKRDPQIWAQVYCEGERIGWHCDSVGAIQFLLCLDAPPAENGGAFLTNGDESTAVHMEAGDAILFKATEILHATSRLTASSLLSNPRRITAVARFFAA